MLRYLGQLRTAGVRVMSHQEPWLDTAGPTAELLLAIFAWVAKQERDRIVARVRAGQAGARARPEFIWAGPGARWTSRLSRREGRRDGAGARSLEA